MNFDHKPKTTSVVGNASIAVLAQPHFYTFLSISIHLSEYLYKSWVYHFT